MTECMGLCPIAIYQPMYDRLELHGTKRGLAWRVNVYGWRVCHVYFLASGANEHSNSKDKQRITHCVNALRHAIFSWAAIHTEMTLSRLIIETVFDTKEGAYAC